MDCDFALALVASSVAAQDVKTNAKPGVDFSKFHTYKWVPIKSASHPNQIVDPEIKQSVDSQLAAKGLTKADGDNADLYLGCQVAVDRRICSRLCASDLHWVAAVQETSQL